MGRYSEYGESGAGWLGELPSHWQLRRISALYDARNEKVSDQDYPPLSVTMQGIVPQLETAAKTQDGDNRKLVRTGDFVINSRSDRRGACGISAYDGSVTLISNVLAPKDRNAMSTRYYSYLFRSEGFADEFYRQGTGIVDDLWSTNWTRMKNILVARPPLAEQESIADYLDAKTAEIDALVADCEREVGLLQEYRKAVISEAVTKGLDPDAPMKSSDVDWIGEIPEGWEVRRIKYMATGKNATFLDGNWIESNVIEDDGIRYLTTGNVGEGIYKEQGAGYISEQTFQDLDCLRVMPGDLMISRLNEPLGRACIAPDTFSQYVVAVDIVILRGDCFINGYLKYAMNEQRYAETVSMEARGSTMKRVSRTILGDMKLPLPTLREQRDIADFLDAKTAEIDSLIEMKEHMADKLREYRRSLISEAVTGKFKVPGV